MNSYYSKAQAWIKFGDLPQTRFRVSVRIPQQENNRYMVSIDLVQTPNVHALVQHLCKMFFIQPPSSATVYRDRDRQLVLVLEPDILIHDIEAIQKDDELVLTSRKQLRKEASLLKQIGWSKPHEASVKNQYIMQQQNVIFDDTDATHDSTSGDNPALTRMPTDQIPPPPNLDQQSMIAPTRLAVRPEKHVDQELFETSGMQEFYDKTLGICDKNDLLQNVNEIAQTRGFKVYRHSDTSNFKEHKLILLCQQYSSTRCPFMLIYRKCIDSQKSQANLQQTMFQLQKYRPEHNHGLYPQQSSLLASAFNSNPGS